VRKKVQEVSKNMVRKSYLNSKISPKVVAISFAILVLLFALTFSLFAWQDAPQTPPGCPSGYPGCDVPLNVGPTPQSKAGKLGVATDLDPNYALTAGNTSNNLGIKVGGPSFFENKLTIKGYTSHPYVGWHNMIELRDNAHAAITYKEEDDDTGWLQGFHGNETLYWAWISDWSAGSGSYLMFLKSNGRLGIGVTNPTEKLDVAGYVKGRSGLCIGDECKSSWDEVTAGAGLWRDAGNYIHPVNYNKFVIKDTGNVGIGTENPQDKLEVVGNIRANRLTDRSNTGYYVDPHATSRQYRIRTNILNFSYGADARTAADGVLFRYNGQAAMAFDDWFRIYDSNNGNLRIEFNVDDASVRANRYYDRNNTSYYVDPAGTSKLNCIDLDGVTHCSWPTGPGAGDITAVYAGSGLTGGGTSGDVTLNVGAGTGISVGSNDIRIRYPSYSCPSGQALRTIDLGTGGSACEAIAGDGAGGCTDVFDSVGTDNGTVYAGGCSDRLYIRGGTDIRTRASGDYIYIDYTGIPGAGSLSCTTRRYDCPGGQTSCANNSICRSDEIATGGGCFHTSLNYGMSRSQPSGDRGWYCDYRCIERVWVDGVGWVCESDPGQTIVWVRCCKIQ
jgi:hypothetical protein